MHLDFKSSWFKQTGKHLWEVNRYLNINQKFVIYFKYDSIVLRFKNKGINF